MKIAIVGHSYVRRLQEDSAHSIHLDLAKNEIAYFGLSGGTIMPGPKCLRDLTARILNAHPGIIFLHLGENGIGNGHLAVTVAEEVRTWVLELLSEEQWCLSDSCFHSPEWRTTDT